MTTRQKQIAVAAGVGVVALLLWRRRANAAEARARPCSDPTQTCVGLSSGAYARFAYDDPATKSGARYVRCESLDGELLADVECASVREEWGDLMTIPLTKQILMGAARAFTSL